MFHTLLRSRTSQCLANLPGNPVQFGSCRALPVVGAKPEAKAVTAVAWNDVDVDVKDILPGGGPVGDKEVDALAAHAALSYGLRNAL